jgi:DNA-binding NtrC family response regulator
MIKTLLLVDDMNDEAIFFHYLLDRYYVDIIYRHSIATAFEFLKTHTPDVIVLDLNLGNDNGFEFLRLKNEKPELAAIPVIVSSGHGEIEMITRALSSGAAGYIIKDSDLGNILKALKKVGILLELKSSLHVY